MTSPGQEKVFAAVARMFPEPALLLGNGGVVRLVNTACRTLFPTDRIEGRPLREMVATPEAELHEYLAMCSRNRQFVLGALSIAGADREVVAYRCEGARVDVSPEAGELVLLRLTRRSETAKRFIELTQHIQRLHTEISQRRSVEEALRASEAFSRSVVDSSIDCIKVLDLEGRLLSMNHAGQRALGIADLARYLHSSWIDFWPGLDRDAARLAVHTATVGGTGQFVGFCETFDGRPRWWSVIVTPIPGPDGRPVRLLSISRDVTDQRRMEQEREALLRAEQAARAQAEASNRTKDEFLAVLSHELRTPLNAILGWTRMLRGCQLDSGAAARALETIERNAQMQAVLVEDLLDVARITAGNLRLQRSEVSLADVIEKAVEAVRPAADNKSISIDAQLVRAEVPVKGDAARLQQVVWNLLTNAVKFTAPGGGISIRLESVDAHARIVVTDTGQGFAPDAAPLLFEPFRQADSSTTRVHAGLGIGLTICKQLVEAHGGTIRAASAGPGRGATFTVTLPAMVTSREPSAREHDTTTPLPDLTGVRVLVLDDDADAREMMAELLHQCRASAVVVSSAADALRVLAGDHPDLIVADIAIPGQDGYEFMRAVRQAETAGRRRIPALAVTAYATPNDRAEAARAGFDAHLAKPIDPQQLAHTISTLSRHPQRT